MSALLASQKAHPQSSTAAQGISLFVFASMRAFCVAILPLAPLFLMRSVSLSLMNQNVARPAKLHQLRRL